MAEIRLHTHAATGGKYLFKVKLLRRSGDIPDGIGIPAFLTVLQGRQVRRGIEEAPVTLADKARFVLEFGAATKKDTDGTLAHLGNSLRKQPVN
jgi:hypothetical protein